MQEAITGSLRAGGDDGEIRMAVYEMHPPDLVKLVFVRVLDDAQAVHPQVPEPEGVGDVDRVPNSLRKERGIDPGRVDGYVGIGSLVELCFAPHIAECEVFTVCAHRRG